MNAIYTIILANLGIFLGEIAAEEPLVHAPAQQSSPALGAAPLSEAPTLSAALQPSRTLRHQSAANEEPVRISDFNIDTTGRLANLIDYHTHYTVDGNDTELIGWSGNIASCDQGTISSSYNDLVLRRINYFRGQAGLPTTVAFDTAKSAAAQQAALVMVREKRLSHIPFQLFPTNPCVTQASEVTASASNLALGTFGLDSIDRLMLDDGDINSAVGHRRWFLYPQAVEMGHGSIPYVSNYTSACVVWVVGAFAAAPAPKPITWPNEGYCPYTLVPNKNAEYARWSFTYPHADFRSATVRMTYNGTDITVTTEPIQNLIADNTLVWIAEEIPSGPPAPDTDSTATVTISGIQNAPFTSYTYNVVIYDPFDLHDPMQVTGPAAPSVDGSSSYQFSSVTSAEGYRVRVANAETVNWTEGAETLEAIIDNTNSGYPIQTNVLSSGGSKSFHLLFPGYGEQSFEIDRTIIPSKDSVFRFKRRFRFFHPESRFLVEISDNDGASWNPFYEAPKSRAGNTSEVWDASWTATNNTFPDFYVDRPIRLRFRIQTGGSFFQWNPGNTIAHYGAFIDDVSVSNSTLVVQQQFTILNHDATTVLLDDATAGAALSTEKEYLLQIAPIVAGHQFRSPPLLAIRPVAPADAWLQTHFAQTEASGEAAPDSDADADGLSNLIERALGLDPTQAEDDTAATMLPSGGLGDSGRPSMGLSIPASPHPDLTYEVQQSSDLLTWTPLARKVGSGSWVVVASGATVDEGDEVDGRSPLTVTAPATVLGDGGIHLRLFVSTSR